MVERTRITACGSCVTQCSQLRCQDTSLLGTVMGAIEDAPTTAHRNSVYPNQNDGHTRFKYGTPGLSLGLGRGGATPDDHAHAHARPRERVSAAHDSDPIHLRPSNLEAITHPPHPCTRCNTIVTVQRPSDNGSFPGPHWPAQLPPWADDREPPCSESEVRTSQGGGPAAWLSRGSVGSCVMPTKARSVLVALGGRLGLRG
ncbi:hypothetical protein C8Q80DRAFT_1197351 [Daedaleopsis nitida]|nr:hypothetical protein C8Q80DRAFT_1197351 [Daedaleopsis nitida]